MATTKRERRQRVKGSVRKKISGTAERPRLSVYRSNTNIYAQLIDDDAGHTLAAANSQQADTEGNSGEVAAIVGKRIAEAAKASGIERVVFDRNGYRYHGRIKAVAEAAREGGLKF